jgi:hypothetical protein
MACSTLAGVLIVLGLPCPWWARPPLPLPPGAPASWWAMMALFSAAGYGLGNCGPPMYELAAELTYPVAVAVGESVIKCQSPLDVLKDTYDHSCY